MLFITISPYIFNNFHSSTKTIFKFMLNLFKRTQIKEKIKFSKNLILMRILLSRFNMKIKIIIEVFKMGFLIELIFLYF